MRSAPVGLTAKNEHRTLISYSLGYERGKLSLSFALKIMLDLRFMAMTISGGSLLLVEVISDRLAENSLNYKCTEIEPEASGMITSPETAWNRGSAPRIEVLPRLEASSAYYNS